jgi:predicted RNA-binding Zn ribbon-like protein
MSTSSPVQAYQQKAVYWYDGRMGGVAALEFLAGHRTLDFLNTIEGRLAPRPEDLLRSPDDLAIWGSRAGLIAPPSPLGRTVAAEFAAAIELRFQLTQLLDARVDGHTPDPANLDAVARQVAAAYDAGTLSQVDGTLTWSWQPTAIATIHHRVAAGAMDLLGRPDLPRIGRCAGDGCGWFFLDGSKRHNRRWCSMRACGQDAKSAGRRDRVSKTSPPIARFCERAAPAM